MQFKEYANLPGVRVYDLNLLPDERGFFMEAFRNDWKEFIEEDQIVQVNMNLTFPGIIRAWHRHLRGQVDYFLAVDGTIKIGVYDDREGPTKGGLVEVTVTSRKPQLVRVPGFYWHGSKNVGPSPSLLMYFTTRLYDYKDPDEERRPWNDPSVIDPVTKQPFDWNKCPHK